MHHRMFEKDLLEMVLRFVNTKEQNMLYFNHLNQNSWLVYLTKLILNKVCSKFRYFTFSLFFNFNFRKNKNRISQGQALTIDNVLTTFTLKKLLVLAHQNLSQSISIESHKMLIRK